MKNIRNIRLILFSLLALVTAFPIQAADATGQFKGHFINSANSFGLPNLHIHLDPDAAGAPLVSAIADPLGMVNLALPPGQYSLRVAQPIIAQPDLGMVTIKAGEVLHRRYPLIVPDAEMDKDNSFEIAFQVTCVLSQNPLPSARIKVTVAPSDPSTPAPAPFEVATDRFGVAKIPRLMKGRYQFEVKKTGWEDYLFPAAPGALIESAHGVLAALKPRGTTLSFTVRGLDPKKVAFSDNTQPILNSLVELTGLSFAGDDVETVPTRQGYTDENGNATFSRLPAIPWKLQVKKPGYDPITMVIQPNQADATLPSQTLTLPLHLETQIAARFSIPNSEMNARLADLAPPLSIRMRISGLPGSETEGLNRLVSDPIRNREFLIRNLLPGRYQLVLESAFYSEAPVYREIHLVSPPQIIELADQEKRQITFDLTPIPARVNGNLLVQEQSANPLHSTGEGGLRGFPSSRLEFRQLRRDGTTAPPVTVATDSQGFFSALLEPGLYHIAIPDLTGFSERRIEYRYFNTLIGQQPPPSFLVRDWPNPSRQESMEIFSGFGYDMQLVISPNWVNLMIPSQFNHPLSLDVPQPQFGDLESIQFQVAGPVNQAVPLRRPAPSSAPEAVFSKLPPGNYRLTATPSAFYNFNDNDALTQEFLDFTIPAWPSYPGAFDAAAGQWVAGERHDLDKFFFGRFKFQDLAPRVEQRTWLPDEQRYAAGVPLPNTFPFAYSLVQYPQVYWESNFIPAIPGALIHTFYGANKWYTHAYTPGLTAITLFVNGPSDNSRPSTEYAGTQLQFRLRTFLESGEELTGIGWQNPNGTVQLTSGAAFTTAPLNVVQSFSSTPNGTVAVPFRGIRSRLQWLNSSPLQAEASLTIVRDMLVSGQVRDAEGHPLTNIVLRAFDKLGRRLPNQGSFVTDANGSFSASLGGRGDPVLLEIVERGYKPFRKLFVPADAEDDLDNLTLALDLLPSPRIPSATLNRFGLFIPGVTKSGDFTDYRENASRPVLTGTWKVEAEASPLNYTVNEPSEGQVSPRNVTVPDEIQELWLVDRRAFLEQGDPTPNIFLGVRTNSFRDVEALLSSILSAKKEDKPFKVSYQRIQAGQAAADHLYSGEFYIPNLPAGRFEPFIVAVTRRGAVGVLPYAYPADRPPLEGWKPPGWIDSGILNAIGTINNFNIRNLQTRSSLETFFPKGKLLPLPEFSGKISLAPPKEGDEPDPKKENFINYEFSISVKSTVGIETPKTGSVLSLGAGTIGAEAGGSFTLAASGKDQKIDISYAGFLNNEYATTNLLNKPAMGKSLLSKLGEVKLKAEGKDTMTFTTTVNDLGERQTFTHSHLGFYESQIAFDLAEKAVVIAIPYAGLIFLTLDSLDLSLPFKVTLTFRFGAGADHQYSWQSVQPRPLNLITTVLGPPRLNFLGSELTQVAAEALNPGPGWSVIAPTERTDLLFMAGVDLKASLGSDSDFGVGGYLSGGLELGAPTQGGDRGVRVKLNPEGEGAPFLEIVGSITGGIEWKVNLLGLQYGASHRWDLLPFQWQFGTEPFHSIYPMPTIKITKPSDVSPAVWVGGKTTLVSDFYSAGTLDFSPGSSPGLVYTQTDPAGGMKLLMSLWSPTGFGAPVEVAKAPGAIVAAALSPLPASQAPFGWMLAWSEIAPADLGNPLAASVLKSAISSDAQGRSWNVPREIATLDKVAVKLDLQRTANRLLLLWMQPTDTILSEVRAIRLATSATLGNWNAPQTLFTAANNLVDFRFVTSPAFSNIRFALTARHRDGWLYGWEYLSGFQSITDFGERHSILPAIAYDSAGNVLKAEYSPGDAAILLSRYQQNTWTELASFPQTTPVTDLNAITLNLEGQERIALSWRLDGPANELWHAWVNPNATTFREPELAAANSLGGISSFSMAPSSNGAALIYHLFDTQSSSIRTASLEPSVPSLVALDLTRDDAGIRLAWPARYSDYRLESSSDLPRSGAWDLIADPELIGEERVLIIQPSGQRKFFRLYKPSQP